LRSSSSVSRQYQNLSGTGTAVNKYCPLKFGGGDTFLSEGGLEDLLLLAALLRT
jgi:hypothetical protein